MTTEKTKEEKNYSPSFIKTPYGSELPLGENSYHSTIIVIAPHTDTAAGISKDKLSERGMRPHDNIAWEQVTFLGYLGGQIPDEHFSLLYIFENKNGVLEDRMYSMGSEFYSVLDNGKKGFNHVLKNVSDTPIVLLIRAEKTPVTIRSETDRTPGA